MARKRVKVTVSTTTHIRDQLVGPSIQRINIASQAGGDVSSVNRTHIVMSSFDLHYRHKRITYLQWLAGTRLLHLHAATLCEGSLASIREVVDYVPSNEGPQHSSTFKAEQFYNALFAVPVFLRPAVTWFIATNITDAPLRTLGAQYAGARDINSLTARGAAVLALLLDHLCLYWGYTMADDAAFIGQFTSETG